MSILCRWGFCLLLLSSEWVWACSKKNEWGGLYLGAHVAGYKVHVNEDLNIMNSQPPLFNPSSIFGVNDSGHQGVDKTRLSGGVQLGYNLDLQENFLLGLEMNYEQVGMVQTDQNIYFYQSPILSTYQLKNSTSVQQFGTLRSRFGKYWGEYLPYVTAGAAVSSFGFNQTFQDLRYHLMFNQLFNQPQWGWTIGGGLEYRPLPHWSFKLEYLYLQFNDKNISSLFKGTGDLEGSNALMQNSFQNFYFQVLSLGINYLF